LHFNSLNNSIRIFNNESGLGKLDLIRYTHKYQGCFRAYSTAPMIDFSEEPGKHITGKKIDTLLIV